MTRLDDTIALLERLVAYPTVSSDSNTEITQFLADKLEQVGARVQVFTSPEGDKANLFATIGPDVAGGILLSGHTDVVPVTGQDWSSDPFVMERRENRLFGRGTCDMKGFVAACVAMAPEFAKRAPTRPVHFAFTHDEEVGCLGAQALAIDLTKRGIRPAMTIVGEPTEMRIIEGHKGCYEYTTRFAGLAGHGSTPDQGVNAVEFATRYLTRLLSLRGDLRDRAPKGCRFDPPWTTINPGALHGGIAHNVIPDHAVLEWEMRPVQRSDADFVRDQMRDYVETELLPAMQAIYPDARIETEVIGEVDGLEPRSQNAARDLVTDLTGANGVDLVSFGTEAGIFQSIGMDVVICGPGSIAQAHKPDEFIEIGQLQQCLKMLERLAGFDAI